jgi:hypothetical protein
MSRLLDFYHQKGRDTEGRKLEEIWQWTDQELEQCHDFIQWMFPLDEPSSVNPDAPLVNQQEQMAFRGDPQLQSAMRRSLATFLRFLGLETLSDGRIVRGENFNERLAIWKWPNHNWLRITRVLKSLRLLGFESEATALWVCLDELHAVGGFVSENSFRYWSEAAEGLNIRKSESR